MANTWTLNLYSLTQLYTGQQQQLIVAFLTDVMSSREGIVPLFFFKLGSRSNILNMK